MSSDIDVVLAAERFGLGDLTEPVAPVGQAWSNEVLPVATTTESWSASGAGMLLATAAGAAVLALVVGCFVSPESPRPVTDYE